MIPQDFKGRAKRLDDVDLPRIGAEIGVGEDEIHAVLDVETTGSGFDALGRPRILFEPHVFHRLLRNDAGALRRAVAAGLAYPSWGARPYPKDSYPRLIEAMKIDATAALKSCSWGLGQVMGENHHLAGYASVDGMVTAMCDDEENHLRAMVAFIKSAGLATALKRHDWASFARGYNGPGYVRNDYHNRLSRAYSRWSKIKDTPWTPLSAAKESQEAAVIIAAKEATPPKPGPVSDAVRPAAPQPEPKGFLARFLASLFKRAST